MINFAPPKPLSFACRIVDLIGGAIDWFERVGARLAEHEDDRRKHLEALVEKWCSRALALEHDVEILHDDAADVHRRIAKIAAGLGHELKPDQAMPGLPTYDLLSFIEERIRSGEARAERAGGAATEDVDTSKTLAHTAFRDSPEHDLSIAATERKAGT